MLRPWWDRLSCCKMAKWQAKLWFWKPWNVPMNVRTWMPLPILTWTALWQLRRLPIKDILTMSYRGTSDPIYNWNYLYTSVITSPWRYSEKWKLNWKAHLPSDHCVEILFKHYSLKFFRIECVVQFSSTFEWHLLRLILLIKGGSYSGNWR